MILVVLLIVFGLTLVFGSVATAYWLASLSCAAQMSGCQQQGSELLFELLFSWVGLVFWGTLALGLFMLWWGVRVKTHHLTMPIRR